MQSLKKILATALIASLCGIPQLVAQQAPATGQENQQPAPAPAQTPQSAPAGQNVPVQPDATVNPSEGPLQPVEPATEPNAEPAAQQPAQTTPAATPSPQAQNVPAAPQPQRVEPQGTAAAQKGATVGGAASQPAGAAIAPAKQRQMHSWLIRAGLIAGAGVAFGTIYALSHKTSSTPPGVTTTAIGTGH
jgi:hypothetical protein